MQTENGNIAADGIEFLVPPANEGALPDDSSDDAVRCFTAFLTQLLDDGYAMYRGGDILVPWDRIYDLIDDQAYTESVALLRLPPTENWRPMLRERGTLSDADFGIAITGWIGPDGKEFRGSPTVLGAVITASSPALLTKESWRTVAEIRSFARRSTDLRTLRENQLGWARIRKAALGAKATLSEYLRKTLVVTPDHLAIHLRRSASEGVVEVTPHFEGQPQEWLASFDRLSLRARYDVPSGDAMTHVIFTPEALSVLKEIKSMPGRRVAGERARAFVKNPYNFLGDDASTVLDATQIEAALLNASIGSTRFFANEPIGLEWPVSITIVETAGDFAESSALEFHSASDLAAFIRKGREAIARGYSLLLWEGYELDLFGDAEDQLRKLQLALARPPARSSISLAEVLDLSQYSERTEGFGVDKAFYSPYIARKRDEEGWIPGNVTFGFQFQGENGTIAVSLDEKSIGVFEQAIDQAKASGESAFAFPGCPQPIPVANGEDILKHLRAAKRDVLDLDFSPDNRTQAKHQQRQTLLIKPNVDNDDYVVFRGEVGPFDVSNVLLPRSLSSGVGLKPHQVEGLAWLQHLWSLSPSCRGALLADDMGLGKTLQILSFVAGLLERDPDAHPVLIVAPVSLLDNWIAEIHKFFDPGALPYLKLYGADKLSRLVPQAAIDADAREMGFAKFFRPTWLGTARIVLTNYETLRDLELAFARETWSVMVCDEAQAIKNPNALVTKAAKKQKSGFTIACTGTPVENSLVDLWCLFDLIQPGLLGALNHFGNKYRRPIETSSDTQRQQLDELRSLIQPQTLRRMKRDVAKDLPCKYNDALCKTLLMSERQKQLFSRLVQHLRLRSGARAGSKARTGMDSLYLLKQFFAHPTAIGQSVITSEPVSIIAKDSPKIAWLVDTLEQIRQRGEKVLVFCELKDLQRTLQYVLRSHFEIPVEIVNGESSANAADEAGRHRRIERFQERDGFGAIILSPLVAGFGLNIQAANHVIHFTRLWNPAKEDQATDRAYRIGQTKDVYVYCPVVTSPEFTTFDVKLDRLLDLKRSLSDDMLNGSSAVSESDFTDIEDGNGLPLIPDVEIIEADLIAMQPQAFEAFCAALWAQQGYTTSLTPSSNDGGIDVVAIKGDHGLLMQCKTSRNVDTALGWDAVKDVAAGAQAYGRQFETIVFRKVAVTNQRFNIRAKEQAAHNEVELLDRKNLVELLSTYRVMRSELERLL